MSEPKTCAHEKLSVNWRIKNGLPEEEIIACPSCEAEIPSALLVSLSLEDAQTLLLKTFNKQWVEHFTYWRLSRTHPAVRGK